MIDGGADNDTITGGPGNDVLTARRDDEVRGEAGNDTLIAFNGTGVVPNDNDLYLGGDGTDTITYEQRTVPVNVTLDNVANDGSAGEADNVQTDIETVIGGSAGDTLTGSANDETLDGRGGNDTIVGGAGSDILRGSDGDDTINAVDGEPDSISCGPGGDHATIDLKDTFVLVGRLQPSGYRTAKSFFVSQPTTVHQDAPPPKPSSSHARGHRFGSRSGDLKALLPRTDDATLLDPPQSDLRAHRLRAPTRERPDAHDSSH